MQPIAFLNRSREYLKLDFRRGAPVIRAVSDGKCIQRCVSGPGTGGVAGDVIGEVLAVDITARQGAYLLFEVEYDLKLYSCLCGHEVGAAEMEGERHLADAFPFSEVLNRMLDFGAIAARAETHDHRGVIRLDATARCLIDRVARRLFVRHWVAGMEMPVSATRI